MIVTSKKPDQFTWKGKKKIVYTSEGKYQSRLLIHGIFPHMPICKILISKLLYLTIYICLTSDNDQFFNCTQSTGNM